MSLVRRLTYLLLLILVTLPLSAQQKERTDSLVRLMSAQSGQLVEENGISYRKIIGPARFLHNDTYLICDTALWNVNTNIIHAIGNVKILQEETVLSGDKLDYYVDDDLAQFRGLVQLEDKDRNTLRTHFLDYNTKDSVAVFQNGASMKDKDGEIIESRSGTYDSKINLFTFTDNVNMFSDSTFIKTNRLTYNTDTGLATFTTATDVWNSDKMLSSGGGWYDRAEEVFFFRNNVHMLSEAQEAWSDSLYYYRNDGDFELLGNIQMVDTTRNVAALGGRLYYSDRMSTVRLTRDAAVMIRQQNEDQIDTTWVGADTLVYKSIMMCDVDSLDVVASKERLKDMDSDPVMEFRHKEAEKRAKERADAWAVSPDNPENAMIPRDVLETTSAEQIESVRQNYRTSVSDPDESSGGGGEPDEGSGPGGVPDKQNAVPDDEQTAEPDQQDEMTDADALHVDPDLLSSADSLSAIPAVQDSTLAADVAIDQPKDTTKIDFAFALGNVKIFRSDMQAACDSLVYNGLDSLARFYKHPLIWNEQNRQYAADSIAVAIRNQNLDRARLMSNAFITIQEDTDLFDQIRATEMMAYFDTTGALQRFDALGGATAMFYLQENDTYATVNKVDCKMLSANFAEGTIDRIYYYENVKNDGYPVVQLPKSERELKGFTWEIDKRPLGRESITSLSLQPTERSEYESRPRPSFKYTDIYFPGYISDIQEKIAKGELARQNAKAAEQAQKERDDSALEEVPVASDADVEVQDNIVQDAENIISEPQVNADMTAPADSTSAGPVISITNGGEEIEIDFAALKKLQKEQQKAQKQADREARWAELDSRDAKKAEIKAQKALERKRKQTLNKLKKMDRTSDRDQRVLEKYQKRYERKKARLIKSGKASEPIDMNFQFEVPEEFIQQETTQQTD